MGWMQEDSVNGSDLPWWKLRPIEAMTDLQKKVALAFYKEEQEAEERSERLAIAKEKAMMQRSLENTKQMFRDFKLERMQDGLK